MRTRVLLSPVLAFAVASAIGAGTYAAYTATTENLGNVAGAGTVALRDDDANAAILSLQDAGPGASTTGCVRVTSDGSLPSLVRLRSQNAGDLLPHLRVRITRGSGSAGGGDCTGFTADTPDHFGLGAGVVYDGPLAALPATWGLAMRDPAGPLPANSGLALAAARSGTVGRWELGEQLSAADDFTGLSGTLLSAHAELLGGAWTRLASSTEDAAITRSGGIAARGNGLAAYTVPVATGDQVVEATVHCSAGATGHAGVTLRAAATADRGYGARYNAPAGAWELVRVTDGAVTVLDAVTAALPAGRAGHVRLRHSGGTLTATVTTHTGATHSLSSTDATYAATGSAGVRLAGASLELDDFRVQLPDQSITLASHGTDASNNGPLPATVNGVQPSATDVQASAAFNGSGALRLPAAGLTTTATIAGWFRLESGTMILRDDTTGNAGWSLGYDDDGHLKYRVSGEVFDTGVRSEQLRHTWRHHALVRDGSAVRYFLDGRLVHSGTVTAATAPVSPWWLMRDGAGGAFSTGNVDQVAIWDRALAADELAAIRDGVVPGGTWHEGESHAYRIQVTVGEGMAVSAKSASATFDWEARSR